MSTNGKNNDAQGVRSVERAVALLDILAHQGHWCSVTDLAQAIDVHKSTAFRLLATLQAHGLVEQDPATSMYRLGFGVLRLVRALTADLDFMQYAKPVCERLSTETGESVNVAILEDEDVVNIAQLLPDSAVVSQNWLGRRTPLHCTSTGKIFLAYLPAARRDQFFADTLERVTPHTVVNRRALKKQLKEIRVRGYACALEELEIGLNAVAAPIRSVGGDVLAAVSVSGPAYRLTRERLAVLGEQVKAAALEVSTSLGYASAAGSP